MTVTEVNTSVQRAVPTSPYPGLRDFREEYAEYFFGRDDERQRIIGNLHAARLTLLYAESGVGKSSLLRAGVVPRVHQSAARRVEKGRDAHYVPVMFSTWSEEPINSVIAAIREAVTPYVAEVPELPADLVGAITVAAEAADATLLIILDQFEELFLYHPSELSGDRRYATELARCVNDPAVRAHLLISIREDAYAGVGDLLNGLIPNVYGNYLHLDHLDRTAARDAIVKPIDRRNEQLPDDPTIEIDDELIEAVLDQVRHDRAGDSLEYARVETTYLQLVMRRLWDAESAAGSHRLRIGTLEDLGGASTIIATHLDASMSQLTPAEQGVAATAFRYLVTPTGTKIALAVEDVAELSGVPADDLAAVMRRLAAADLHILRRVAIPDAPDVARYEIFHDALADPISDWRRRFTRERDREELESKVAAERVEKERAQAESEVATARAHHERRRRKRAVVGMITAVSALVLTLIAGLLYFRHDSHQNQAEAEAASSADRLADFESASFPPGLIGLAEIETQRLSPTFGARHQVSRLLQENVASPRIDAGNLWDVTALKYIDDSLLALGSADGTVQLWDERGRDVTPSGISEDDSDVGVTALASWENADRSLLVVGRWDGSVDLWDVSDPEHADEPPSSLPATRSAIPGLPNPPEGSSEPADSGFVPSVTAIAASPDGSEIAVAYDDGALDVAKLVGGTLTPTRIGNLADTFGFVTGLAYSDDGGGLALGTLLGVATMGRVDGGWTGPDLVAEGQSVYGVAYNPDGTLVWSDEDSIDRRDGSGAITQDWLPTAGTVNSLAFTPDGALVSGGDDASVTVWDPASGRPVGPPRSVPAGYSVTVLAVSPDGEWLAGAASDGLVRQWPADTSYGSAGAMTLPVADPRVDTGSYGVSRLAFGSAGRAVAVEDDGRAVIWKESSDRSLEFEATIAPPDGMVTKATAIHDDQLVVASIADGTVLTVYDLSDGCASADPCPAPAGSIDLDSTVVSVDLDRTGRILAVGDEEGGVHVFELSGDNGLRRLESSCATDGSVTVVDFSPTSQLIAVADDDGAVRLCDVGDAGAKPLGRVVEAADAVSAMAFSATGDRLATGGPDQQVTIWSVDPETKVPLTRSPSAIIQTNEITALAFSPDSSVLAVGDADGSACLWDTEFLRPVGSCLTVHYGVNGTSAIDALAFSPDGRTLLTGGRLNSTVAWDSVLWGDPETDPDVSTRQLDLMCTLAGRNLTAEEWRIAFEGTSIVDERHRTCPELPA